MIVIKVLITLALLSVILYFVPFVFGPMTPLGVPIILNFLLGAGVGVLLMYLWEDELYR